MVRNAVNPKREQAERELKHAVRALEDALDAVRRARRDGGTLDVEAVRAALDAAEKQLQRAQVRLRRALDSHEQALDAPGRGESEGDTP